MVAVTVEITLKNEWIDGSINWVFLTFWSVNIAGRGVDDKANCLRGFFFFESIIVETEIREIFRRQYYINLSYSWYRKWPHVFVSSCLPVLLKIYRTYWRRNRQKSFPMLSLSSAQWEVYFPIASVSWTFWQHDLFTLYV